MDRRRYGGHGGFTRWTLLTALLALTLLAPQVTRARQATPVPAPVAAILDLAGMTLTPADLAAAGLPGFGVDFGETLYPDQLAAGIAASEGVSEQAAIQTVKGFGFQRWYESYLYLPADPAAPRETVTSTVSSYVLEFADAAGASDAWAVLEDESDDPTVTDLSLTTSLGDQAEATRYTGTDPATGDAFVGIDLTVQLGELQLGVRVVDWSGAEPDLGTTEALAGRLLERADAIRVSGGPGTSNQVLRLAGAGVESSLDGYYLLAGEPIHRLGESREDVERRRQNAVRAGTQHVYTVWQRLAAGAAPEGDVWYLVDLVRFADEATASAWLAATPDRLAADANNANVLVDPSAPTVGDESRSYSFEGASVPVTYRSVAVRVGTAVAFIDLQGPVTPPADAVATLAEAQVACLQAGTCVAPLPLPSVLGLYLFGLPAVEDGAQGTIATPPAATPSVMTPTPASAASETPATPAGGETRVYRSERYGYTLTYDPAVWTLTLDDVADAEEWIQLNSATSEVAIAGRPGTSNEDLVACVETYLVDHGWDNGAWEATLLEPMRIGADRVAGAYTLEDKIFGESTAYMSVECRAIGDGSTLLITHFVFTKTAEPVPAAEVAAFERLMAGLVVDTAVGSATIG